MTSFAPQASQRHSTQEQTVQSPSQHAPQLEPAPESFVINPPQVDEAPNTSTLQAQERQEAPKEEVHRCWICQQDSTEDAPGTEWRTPCPCSLTAHDSCLLEWIIAEEAPRPGELATTRHIVCPQCHTEIKIERPRDYLVLATESLQRMAKSLVIPAALSSLFACFYSGFLMYGINTLQMVFGHDEAYRIMAQAGTRNFQAVHRLQPDHGNRALQVVSRLLRTASMSFDPFLPTTDWMAHWKLFIGLPLIAPSLVLSRTRLAEPFFTIVPVTYLLFRPTSYLHLQEWPPSPSATIAVLPYFRAFYNELYRYAFADLEKKWDAAVQRRPREGETAEDIAQAQDEQEEFLNLQLEFINEEEDFDPVGLDNQARAAAGRNQAPAPVAGVEQANQQPGQDEAGALPVNNDPARRGGQNGNNNIGIRRNVSASAVASTVMGALFLPTISSVMGDLLKVTLPKDWVTKKGVRAGSMGLLQEKWGRSIVGGCLFIVIKDALLLYCKWKKARDFGKKRVLDYVGKRNGQSSPAVR